MDEIGATPIASFWPQGDVTPVIAPATDDERLFLPELTELRRHHSLVRDRFGNKPHGIAPRVTKGGVAPVMIQRLP